VEDETVIPVIREEVDAGTRTVETGAVRVHKTVHEHQEVIQQSLAEEHVEIQRVTKNQRVNGPQPIRHEGDTIIVPVVKEVLRVEKDWVLTEEIRLTRRREDHQTSQPVSVAHEEAEVVRLDASGNHAPPDAECEPLSKKGVLGEQLPKFLDLKTKSTPRTGS